MKITFVGHASILIESKGIKILSDPWWGHPCFGAQWWGYPSPFTECVNPNEIDFIYISHGHHDHFHPGTLKQFSRSSKVVVSSRIGLAEEISKLGFDVISVNPEAPICLPNGIDCFIWPTYNDDTLMVIDDNEEICINANDALHSAPVQIQDQFVRELKNKFSKVDYLFCGYGVASHFPNCYKIPGKDDYRTAANRQMYFDKMWARIVAGLASEFAFPFAADVVFLEKELFFVNDPTHNSSRPIEYLQSAYPGISTKAYHIAPGFCIENRNVAASILRKPLDIAQLIAEKSSEIERANRYGEVNQEYIDRLVGLLKKNISVCCDYLNEYSKDYTFGIQFKNSQIRIIIKKVGTRIEVFASEEEKISVDIMLTTRASYLKQSLSNIFGGEILFVGSGAIFDYWDKKLAVTGLHNELKVLVTYHDSCPNSRFGTSGKFLFYIKKFVKNILRLKESNLYDLGKWVVFRD